SGRLGGDEFCLFYRGYVSDEMAGDLANRLIVAFDEALGAAGYEGLTSISLGIALSDRADEDNYNILYKRADNALYQAKSAGRKTYSIYKDS
ncbi:MAG: GGDEF domain-containing protein, partial [Lachnospiraceae bacterium]|nr:GGDEF domain-containing protein [Lachnospiraceae bacterium]